VFSASLQKITAVARTHAHIHNSLLNSQITTFINNNQVFQQSLEEITTK